MHHIAFCFDKNYEQHFAAALMSVVMNVSGDPADLTFHAVALSSTPQLDRFVSDMQRLYGVGICVYHVGPDHQVFLDQVPERLVNIRGYLSIASYLRILLPAIVPESVRQLVYLDSDTITLGDIKELTAFDMKGAPAASVRDPDEHYGMNHIGTANYFNSGVMVMDLTQWRAQSIAKACFDYLASPDCKAQAADQCAINFVLDGRIADLPTRWNTCVASVPAKPGQLAAARSQRALLHYFTANKPWHAWYQNELGSYYWAYQTASPWPDGTPVKPSTVKEYRSAARHAAGEGRYKDALADMEKVADYLAGKVDRLMAQLETR